MNTTQRFQPAALALAAIVTLAVLMSLNGLAHSERASAAPMLAQQAAASVQS
ncbi:MAG: hypothetical protein HY021_07280 [Burkholderiales bacterium]|nr:hypothetical protein [Burkholderiales bacterium]